MEICAEERSMCDRFCPIGYGVATSIDMTCALLVNNGNLRAGPFVCPYLLHKVSVRRRG
jgi:hypothetical protein